MLEVDFWIFHFFADFWPFFWPFLGQIFKFQHSYVWNLLKHVELDRILTFRQVWTLRDKYRKIPNVSPGFISPFWGLIFGGAYIRRGLYSEAFKCPSIKTSKFALESIKISILTLDPQSHSLQLQCKGSIQVFRGHIFRGLYNRDSWYMYLIKKCDANNFLAHPERL